MPTDPIDEQILQAIKTRLSGIAKGATYFFTPGEVSRDWKNFDEVKTFPFYGIIEGTLVRAESTYTTVMVTLPVIIVGWVRHETDRRSVLNRAVADLIRAIYIDETWGGLALITKVTSRISDEATVSAKPHAYFELNLQIEYQIDRAAA